MTDNSHAKSKPAPTLPWNSKPQYRPKGEKQILAYLVEECGEVLAAAGKSLRWNLDSSNPELPPEQRETNAAWLARELLDLEQAIAHVRPLLAAHGETVPLKGEKLPFGSVPKMEGVMAEVTEQQTRALIDAVWQVLDDFQTGTSCCSAVKALLRYRFQPFLNADPNEFQGSMEGIMTFDQARAVLVDIGVIKRAEGQQICAQSIRALPLPTMEGK